MNADLLGHVNLHLLLGNPVVFVLEDGFCRLGIAGKRRSVQHLRQRVLAIRAAFLFGHQRQRVKFAQPSVFLRPQSGNQRQRVALVPFSRGFVYAVQYRFGRFDLADGQRKTLKHARDTSGFSKNFAKNFRGVWLVAKIKNCLRPLRF